MEEEEEDSQTAVNENYPNDDHINRETHVEDDTIDEEAFEDEEWYNDENIVDEDNGYQEASDGTLQQYFSLLQDRLSRQEYPREYSNGTFWINPPAPFFILKKSNLDPSRLYYPRVFLWLPHHLIQGKLRCPACNHSLENKGFNKNPHARRVVDIDRYVAIYHVPKVHIIKLLKYV